MVAWFAGNSVAANLLMVVILVGGASTAATIKTELFPEFSLDFITVSVPYPGAAPEDVEQSICVRIEEEIHSIEGIKKVTSTAAEGSGTVMVELLPGADARRVLDDVKTRVDAIETFPEEAEKPIIQELTMRSQVINVAVSGPADELTLKRLGERVRDEINAIEGISQVTLSGAREYEISIEVSEQALRRFGLSFQAVADAVRGASLDLSGGSVKTRGGEVLLRTQGQAYSGEEFGELVVMSAPDGTRIRLRDVALVVDGFEDTDQSMRFNKRPAVMVQVYRMGDQNALTVAGKVHDYVNRARYRMPEGIELTIWGDAAVFLRGRLDLLIKNGLQGLGLVFLVLALFLRFRLAFWVTLGIPISFMGALWVMPFLGASVNMLSLFGFILVLGIVVDDAIVVGESIFSEQKRGLKGLAGAVRGAERVAVPVTFAVLTTVVAFTPMLGLPGVMGKFFKVMPIVVIPTLLFSWVESKMILPAHLAHTSARLGRLGMVFPFSLWTRLQGLCERGMEGFAANVYQPVLDACLRWRYLTLAVGFASLMLVAGLIGGGFVRFAFFNAIEGDIVAAQLTMPLGTSATVTAEAVDILEEAAARLRREIDEEYVGAGEPSVVTNYMATVGDQPYRAMQKNNGVAGGNLFAQAHRGEVMMELLPAEEREVSSSDIVKRWRELVGPLPGAVELIFSSDIMSAGDAINVQFAGEDTEELRAAADELKAELVGFNGVFDVSDSFRGGKQEIKLSILPGAEALGLTLADLARQVRQGFYGEEAQRIQRGRNDVRVMVRYPFADRRSLHGLESMRIRTPMGADVPFSSVARAELTRGYATIERFDRHRMIRVTASADKAVADTGDIVKTLTDSVLPGILDRHPGVAFSLEGENREEAETMGALKKLFLLAMLAIYALMAIPFRSYIQPAIVMTAVPFGLIGAVVGHMVMGIELSVLSMCGIIALAGVVVNDSLVLVDFVNRRREDGMSVAQAARTAGVQRFRPILLTSLTTFAGLTPLILEKSVQAQFLVPMAVSLAYGVLFSTAISLVIVPACYLILEDFLGLGRRLFGESVIEADVPAEGLLVEAGS
ncbi:MAG: multidrug efflux pump subunit AcrB [Chlamydiales bacterium]|jgi:multidrug efflux pump subunit AcrB